MPSLKRNTYLDDGDSDDDAQSDVSADNERGRNDLAVRAQKRRKVDLDGGNPASDSDGESARAQSVINDTTENQDANHEEPQVDILARSTAPKSVARAKKAAHKSGVVYISRIPPFMKPHTLKRFLAPHAQKGLGRVFLTPEDHDTYMSRKKNGGNKKKSFTDGWVEFVSKTEAKAAAEILNGNIIGGKKRGYYHDDIWNMKYLSAFKWSHLTEQIAAENAEREARMREEIRKTRQENSAFIEDFERGKMLETMEAKSKARGESLQERRPGRQPARRIKQAKAHNAAERSEAADDAKVQRTLSMIFCSI